MVALNNILELKMKKYSSHLKNLTMKNLLLSIFIITGMAACQNNTTPDENSRNIQLLTDTTAYQNNVFSDTPVTVKAAVAPAKISEKPRVIIVRTEKSVPAKSTVAAPVYTQPAAVPAASTEPIATTPAAGNDQSATKDAGSATSGNGPVAAVPEVAKKKGWSKAAQGAAIGGVGGAVGGAIISKKKGLGAIVGGVVGAAGGYIIGKNMDKKDNRLVME